MSVAYEQSTFSLIGARVRRLVLGIVLFTSLAVNVVFAICTLVNPVSLYALLVFALIIAAIGYLVEFTLADAEEVADAVMTDIYPALLRAPVCMSYEWIVGAWLAWWLVTQLMWAADIVYQRSIVTSLIIVPLLLLYMLLRVLSRTLEWASQESFLVLAIQLVTFAALFFPTTEWAPQYSGVVGVCVRVVLFFIGVMLATFLEPPHWDVLLDDPVADSATSTGAPATADSQPLARIELEIKALMQNTLFDVEGVSTQQRQRRFERARAMLAAHARTGAERRRMRNTVALTAWVLVLPLQVTAFVYPLLLGSMILDNAKAKRAPKAPLAAPLTTNLPAPLPPTPAPDTARLGTPQPTITIASPLSGPVAPSTLDSGINFGDKSRLQPAKPPNQRTVKL